MSRLAVAFLCSLGLTTISSQPLCHADNISAKDRAFFENKIRPVLVEHCYECHSAESNEVGGKLLVDRRQGMLEGGESGPAVVAGRPNESLIIQALRYQDDLQMPPEDPLPESVINDFVKWVSRGAADPRPGEAVQPATEALDPDALWSFQPRQVPQVPVVADHDWPRDPIDHFVLARIEAAALKPTNDADSRTLARRLYYDLIGLPPTFQQLEAFAQQHRRDGKIAVEQLVDSLLDSPHFGERWGRHWLDVARYGESNGDDGLGRNATFPHAWRYRDYVIDALNSDLPYDQFLTQQIAGDLLPAEHAQQRNQHLVATGFLAIGSKPAAAMNKNFAMDVVDDQINVVSTAVMGLSVACARCHDHKHDPIPTRDYYAMAGIFASTETLYGRAGNEKLTAPATELHQLRSKWSKDDAKEPKPGATPKFPETYAAAIDQLQPSLHAKFDVAPDDLKIESNVKFSAKNFAEVKAANIHGQLSATGDSYSVAFWFKNDTKNDARPITAYLFSRAKLGDQQLPGDHLGIGGKHDPSRAGKLFVFNGNERKVSIAGSSVIPHGSWNHVALVRQGIRVKVFLNGQEEIDTEMEATFGESLDFCLANRSDEFAPLVGNLAEFAIFERGLSDDEALLLHEASGQPRGRRDSIGLAMGVREKEKPSDCKIHIDGDGSKLGPVVPRGFLTACNPVSPITTTESLSTEFLVNDKQSGRRQLAAWLTSPSHPQTARVMANRIWMQLFGQGIVATPDDFGVYGARPTHPELLDYLAERFVRDDWSIKRLIRSVVLSRTYQLDSRCEEQLVRADPENQWLARHNRRRLDAESLRDSMLQSSGNLDLRWGQGSAIEHNESLINWPPGEATNLHRDSNHRSVYLCMLRHSPPPELAAFDLPDGVAASSQRAVTTLPTQALFLLNSRFVVEQAEAMARRYTCRVKL